MTCATCRRFHRVRRTFWERLYCRAAYACDDCKRRMTVPRRLSFHFALDAHCPQCGSAELRRLSARDNVESMSRHPLSRMQRWLGGHLYYCALCRLQFYDWRGRERQHSERTMMS